MKRFFKAKSRFLPSLNCNGGSYEDDTLDDTYTYKINSKSISFDNTSQVITSEPPMTMESERLSCSPSDFRTGGVFAERWLELFALALDFGIRSEQAIHEIITSGGYQMNTKLASPERSREQKARFLRRREQYSAEMHEKDEYFSRMDALLKNTNDDNLLPMRPGCSFLLCLGMNDPGAINADHGKSTMAVSAQHIRKILGEKLRLVLDLKSRGVPPRVWSRLVENLASRGLVIDGVGSFDIDELRMIRKHTSIPLTGILFFHSAGDLQRACHANENLQ